MKPRSGWSAARGQIAWIMALIVSTGIVIQLERLDLGSRLAGLDSNPMSDAEPAWALALLQARLEAPDPGNATPSDQLALLLALSLAALHPNADLEALATEARTVIDAVGPGARQDPMLRDGVTLARQVFGL